MEVFSPAAIFFMVGLSCGADVVKYAGLDLGFVARCSVPVLLLTFNLLKKLTKMQAIEWPLFFYQFLVFTCVLTVINYRSKFVGNIKIRHSMRNNTIDRLKHETKRLT